MNSTAPQIFLACALAAVFAAVPAHAGETTVSAALDRDEIFVGESVHYRVTVSTSRLKERLVPDLAAHATDFNVTALGSNVISRSSSANGVEIESVNEHIFQYELRPKRAGELKVPAPSVTVNQAKVLGPELVLKVAALQQQDLALLEIVPSRARVYPTQPFEINLRILLKPLPDSTTKDPLLALPPPSLEIGWLEVPAGLSANKPDEWLNKFLTNTRRGFKLNDLNVNAGFMQERAVLSLYTGRQKRKGLGGTEIEYFVYELKRTFTPEKSGNYSFGPALLKGIFADGIAGNNYNARRLVVSSDTATVEVRDVPQPRPADFCGGIGTYKLAATASPETLRIGDPLTLVLEFERAPQSGSLDLIAAPDLAANPALLDAFDIIDKAPTGEVRGNVKRFAYGLRPKKAGAALPAVTASVFNPASEQFETLRTAPVALNVVDSPRLKTDELVSGVANPGANDLQNRTQGIFQNITSLAELNDQRVNAGSYALCFAGLLLLYGGLALLTGIQRRRAGDEGWQRRRRARGEAERELAQAATDLTADKKHEALRGMRAALTGMIGNLLNLPAASMTAHEAGELLQKHGCDATVRQRVVAVIEEIEAAEYGAAGAGDLQALVARAGELLPLLQRELENAA